VSLLSHGRSLVERSRLAVIVALPCLAAVVSWLGMAGRTGSPPGPDIASMLSLPFTKAGVRACLVVSFHKNMPPSTMLQWSYAGRKHDVLDLNGFRGGVEIRSPHAALSYVRLLTAPVTAFTALHQGYEIVSRPAAERNRAMLGDMHVFWQFGNMPHASGGEGVLSAQAYRRGGFTPTSVKSLNGGFEITRWLYFPGSGSGPGAVAHVRESVTADGTYRRVTLTSSDPPHLPDTYWSRMMMR